MDIKIATLARGRYFFTYYFLFASAALSISFTATSNWVSIPFNESSGLLYTSMSGWSWLFSAYWPRMSTHPTCGIPKTMLESICVSHHTAVMVPGTGAPMSLPMASASIACSSTSATGRTFVTRCVCSGRYLWLLFLKEPSALPTVKKRTQY